MARKYQKNRYTNSTKPISGQQEEKEFDSKIDQIKYEDNCIKEKEKYEDVEKSFSCKESCFFANQNPVMQEALMQFLINSLKQNGSQLRNDETDVVDNKRVIIRKIIIFILVLAGFCACFYFGYKSGYQSGFDKNKIMIL